MTLARRNFQGLKLRAVPWTVSCPGVLIMVATLKAELVAPSNHMGGSGLGEKAEKNPLEYSWAKERTSSQASLRNIRPQ